ncbi:tryptophanyl-tRNA synthetase [Desulfitispora alkaliphila]|uniref:tryptophan--tRNA ligase n=1 Tax=Desulfitispora alkaliphila TaxID=622674 RepID=UPI003D1CFD12
MIENRILSGMRPTGKLHIGHLSVLENWAKLQEDYKCFFMVADWHALTTAYDNTDEIKQNRRDMALDWLSVGIDPERSVIFVQSEVKQHAELHLLFSMNTPISWLERCPTYKDQVAQLGKEGKDINTYGFLGYPLLQAADILAYRADTVPVGEDQIPHLEMTREIARRFNHIYDTQVFPEPKAKLAKVSMLPGLDGRKMSKSYGNIIEIGETGKDLQGKVRQMTTDPNRIKKDDPGDPGVCVVNTYHGIYSEAGHVTELQEACRRGEIGCVQCKKALTTNLSQFMDPIRTKRDELSQNSMIDDILAEGAKKAALEAEKTMEIVRSAMKL